MSTNATPVSFTRDQSERARIALQTYAFALGVVPEELDRAREEISLTITPEVSGDTRAVFEDAAVVILILGNQYLANLEKRVWRVVREATGLEV